MGWTEKKKNSILTSCWRRTLRLGRASARPSASASSWLLLGKTALPAHESTRGSDRSSGTRTSTGDAATDERARARLRHLAHLSLARARYLLAHTHDRARELCACFVRVCFSLPLFPFPLSLFFFSSSTLYSILYTLQGYGLVERTQRQKVQRPCCNPLRLTTPTHQLL